MADYTPITSGQTDPGQPVTSALVKALEENPRAIAEGAVGAPRIDPIAAMAHQGVAGAVGTYVFARRTGATSDVAFGGTTGGANLQPASAAAGVSQGAASDNVDFALGSTLSGTWRCMGNYDHVATSGGGALIVRGATLWLRVV